MLDKKAIRKFLASNPAPIIPPNHGLLHAQQIAHIIRTAVRNVAGRRTLILHVYGREQAEAGVQAPVWTIFHVGGDYATLERDSGGNTSWRSACFKNLDRDWRFLGKCAFYSSKDEERVYRFFRVPDGERRSGLISLMSAQQAILDKRAARRQIGREKKALKRMEPIRALPRGLVGWIRRSVMPAYFMCAHANSRKPVTGTCTSCNRESTLPHAVHGEEATCPRCGRKLTVRSVAKAGWHEDMDTALAIQRTGEDEICVRTVKARYVYKRGAAGPERIVYENMRTFMRQGPNGKAVINPYYLSGSGRLTRWKPGYQPAYFPYSRSFNAERFGHIYAGGLEAALSGTPWEYAPVAAFYGHGNEPMELAPFLARHLEGPALERLVKTDFFEFASDLAYGRVAGDLLDGSQDRTHRMLRVAAEDVAFLRGIDAGADMLRTFQGYSGLKDRQALLLWQTEHRVKHNIMETLEHGVTPRKLMNYAGKQHALLSGREGRYGGARYKDVQAVVSEFRDYLDMLGKLDDRHGLVGYPRDLQQAHDAAQACLKAETDAKTRAAFKAAMEAIAAHPGFEADGLAIAVPSCADEVIAEGKALHTCVGTYVDRVARQECVILFIRMADAPDVPYYTMEIRDRKAVQVRGDHNKDATPEVRRFVDAFERQVLAAA